MRFILKVDLGNEAMQTGPDVAEALRRVADVVQSADADDDSARGRVRDLNGNTVGRWEFTESEVA